MNAGSRCPLQAAQACCTRAGVWEKSCPLHSKLSSCSGPGGLWQVMRTHCPPFIECLHENHCDLRLPGQHSGRWEGRKGLGEAAT